MNNTLFKRLVDCEAEGNWEHVKDVITAQLMGDAVFPVPRLVDAASFDIGQVVLKGRRTKLERLTGVMTSALPAGPLSKFVTQDPEHNLMQRPYPIRPVCQSEGQSEHYIYVTRLFETRLGNVKKGEDSVLNQAYEFHESDMRNGVKKSITVQIWGCEKCEMEFVPKPADLTVDVTKRGYLNIDRIFLITEVHFASEIKIYVTIGDREDSVSLKGHIPIGFSLVKYKLEPNGKLGEQKKVKPSKWRAHWIQKLVRDEDDPLPYDPFQKTNIRKTDSKGTAV